LDRIPYELRVQRGELLFGFVAATLDPFWIVLIMIVSQRLGLVDMCHWMGVR